MLINKVAELKEGEIMAFYLSSGEEVVGEIITVSDDTIVLNRPFKVALTQNGPAYFPFSFCIETDNRVDIAIPFAKNTIISHYSCSSHIVTEYQRLTTGIEIPDNNVNLQSFKG
jgi:hypothetical protein